MDPVYWSTEEPHADNSETMQDYLATINLLDIVLVDGPYAEGTNSAGETFEIHAMGNGDYNNHKVKFKRINN